MHRQSPTLQLRRCRTLGGVLAAILLSAVASPASAQSRVANPYVGVKGYVNPDWAAKANAESGGSRISNQPTAIWMDQIAAIAGANGAMGMRAHLDNALATGAGYIQFVIYDLPGRDCSALSSNGELGPTEIGRYKTEFIDPIAAIQTDSKYASLRIINIIEIDSLPNIVTNGDSQNTATDACRTMKANGNYVAGVQYALSKLGNSPNIYNYVDAAHHGWLGWDSNFGPAATLFANTIKGATGGANTISGLIANTANYSATTEPYFTINDTVNNVSVRQSKWVDWNFYVDEQSFGLAFVKQVGANLGRSDLGLLIDTSRNGWGGSARPTGPGPKTDVDSYVNGSRIDRRIHTGNWCNQSGAGLGERPTVAPASGVHAYVWIKPPGESDGSDHETTSTRGLDGMCNPSYGGNARNGNSATGALANSPIAGAWFSAQFQQLMTNAYPPLGNPGTCTTAPSAPASATATASGTTITLSWASVTPPTNCSVTYNVYRSTTSGFTPSSSNQIGSGLTTTSSVSTGLSASTTYYFVVRAVDAAGSSADVRASATTGTVSNTCAAAPPAVTTLTAQVVSSSQINLSWSAVTPPANCSVTYNVYRSTTNGFTPSSSNQIATGLTTTSRNDTGLAASTTYYYAVQATDSFGSAAVARVSGTTLTGTAGFALTVTKTGSGAGTVTSNTGGINCGSTCTATYTSGTTVTLTASASSGSTFAGWSGCTGTGTTCTVSMTQARAVVATFNGGTNPGQCANPITFTANTNNFNTTGAVCYRTSATVNGWGCYNFDGRTVSVNGGTATAACGGGQLPLAKSSDGYTYFSISAGTYAWAGLYTY